MDQCLANQLSSFLAAFGLVIFMMLHKSVADIGDVVKKRNLWVTNFDEVC